MAARELTLGGTPVLIYHGLGAVVPADVDDREGKYWVSPASFGRQLAMIREGGHRVGGRGLHGVIDADRAVRNRKFAVKTKMNERGSNHGVRNGAC